MFARQTKLYETLQVSPSATHEEIRSAYKKLALVHHPDKSDNDEGIFVEIQKAAEILMDAKKRKAYDLGGEEMVNVMGKVDSMFGQFQTGEFENAFAKNFSSFFNAATKPAAKKFSVDVSMEDAFARKPQTVIDNMWAVPCEECTFYDERGVLQRKQGPCDQCGMAGLVYKTQTLVCQPTLFTSAQKVLSFPGCGDSIVGQPPVDATVTLNVVLRPGYLVGTNGLLRLEKTISLKEALYGLRHTLVDLDGTTFQIAADFTIQPNSHVILRGYGMPVSDRTRGDLVIVYTVVIPPVASEEALKDDLPPTLPTCVKCELVAEESAEQPPGCAQQ